MTKPSKKADLTKLSHLIRAGAIVHTVNGGVYRCTSKFASGGEVYIRLADLQGKPVQTPAGFYPISPALARFAAWMRYVVAYNKDFDLYVKEYIKAAGLPIDPEMNWAKFLTRVVAPKLISRDPEIQDEAIHQIIIKALAERSILDSNNPNGFSNAIKKFPPAVQQLPLAKQVTRFLEKAFAWRVTEANEYIRRFVFQDQTDSMWGGEDEDSTDVNLLDTEDNAGGAEGYDMVEADVEVERFRKGFGDWLHKKYREDTAHQYLTLFDIVYEEVKASEDAPGASDVLPEWYRQTAERCSSCNGTGRWGPLDTKGRPDSQGMKCPDCKGMGAVNGKSTSWLKVLFSNLPKLIDLYITKYLKNYDVHPFLEIMRQINKDRELVATASMNGLRFADAEELPVTAAKQWEIPKCKSCGGSENAADCLGCHEKFCPDCLINHHANNPSHNRIASSLDDEYAQGDDYYACAVCHTKNWTRDKDETLRCLTCHPDETKVAHVVADWMGQ